MFETSQRYRGRRAPSAVMAILALLFLALCGGCAAVGPDYTPASPETPDRWRNGIEQQNDRAQQQTSNWWDVFGDPQLTSLVNRAVGGNLDVRTALSRVEASRLQWDQAGAARLPEVTADGSASKSESRTDDGQSATSERHGVSIAAGWEIDLFGGLQRSLEAATADYQASVEDLRDVSVALLAEVALAYIDLRTYQNRLSLARSEAVTRQESLALLEAAAGVGQGDQLAIEQARLSLASVQAGIPALETSIEIQLNRLALLLGREAGALHGDLSEVRPVPQLAETITIGIPAETLRQRPDVRRAERQLAAQTARIGEAEAKRYPHLSLSGSIGIEALSLDKLVSAPTRLWSIGPSVSWPIFDAGSLRAAVAIQSESQRQAEITYRQTILTALEEVENELAAYGGELSRQDRLDQALNAARSVLALTEQQFRIGLVDYHDVLDAHRSVLSLTDQQIQAKAAVAADVVRLYRALGGGWQSFTQLADMPLTMNEQD